MTDTASNLAACSRADGTIAALAIDQRNSLRSALQKAASGKTFGNHELSVFKTLVSETLTPYASGVLLDPVYGLDAAARRAPGSGFIAAYEASGYDSSQPGRLPDLSDGWSVRRLAEQGANAIKLLVYYDPRDTPEINRVKQAFVERVGAECFAEGLPLFLEPLTYRDGLAGDDLAHAKAELVRETAREFSEPRYRVDVLKLEFPIDPNKTEGVGAARPLHSRAEASETFAALDAATTLPYIFLSAGVDMAVFVAALAFAREAGSRYRGVLCGRATWKGAIPVFATQGAEAARSWLSDQGAANIRALNAVLER